MDTNTDEYGAACPCVRIKRLKLTKDKFPKKKEPACMLMVIYDPQTCFL